MNCYSCLHLMDGADGIRRCRVDRNALPVSAALEADCTRYVREPGSDDAGAPEWYWKHEEGK